MQFRFSLQLQFILGVQVHFRFRVHVQIHIQVELQFKWAIQIPWTFLAPAVCMYGGGRGSAEVASSPGQCDGGGRRWSCRVLMAAVRELQRRACASPAGAADSWLAAVVAHGKPNPPRNPRRPPLPSPAFLLLLWLIQPTRVRGSNGDGGRTAAERGWRLTGMELGAGGRRQNGWRRQIGDGVGGRAAADRGCSWGASGGRMGMAANADGVGAERRCGDGVVGERRCGERRAVVSCSRWKDGERLVVEKNGLFFVFSFHKKIICTTHTSLERSCPSDGARWVVQILRMWQSGSFNISVDVDVD